MNIRRLVLDVDKAMARPSLIEIGEAISACPGVAALNITVGEIDVETIGMDVTIEGEGLDYELICRAIERAIIPPAERPSSSGGSGSKSPAPSRLINSCW